MKLYYKNVEELFVLMKFCNVEENKPGENLMFASIYSLYILEKVKQRLFKKYMNLAFSNGSKTKGFINLEIYEALAIYLNASIIKTNEYELMVFTNNIRPLHQQLISINNSPLINLK